LVKYGSQGLEKNVRDLETLCISYGVLSVPDPVTSRLSVAALQITQYPKSILGKWSVLLFAGERVFRDQLIAADALVEHAVVRSRGCYSHSEGECRVDRIFSAALLQASHSEGLAATPSTGAPIP
jgi:hypothetical protein